METTILKLSELYRKEGLKEYNEYIDFLNKKFNSYSLDELTQMMKSYLSIISIPDWAKEGVMKSKALEYRVDSNGVFKDLKISEQIYSPDDAREHYYVELVLTLCFFYVKAGTDQRKMTIYIDIEDIETFLDKKI